MADFVLDASVAISWCFPGDPTEDTPYSRELITRDAIVPEVSAFEITNDIFVSHNKRKRIDECQVMEYLGLRKAYGMRESRRRWISTRSRMVTKRRRLRKPTSEH